MHYTSEALVGRMVIGCINLGEKNIAGFTSQFLLLGFSDHNNSIWLATIDPYVANGGENALNILKQRESFYCD